MTDLTLAKYAEAGALGYILTKIVLPSGTLQVALRDILSLTDGLYEGRVMSFDGEFVWALPDISGNIVTSEIKLRVSDTDRRIFKVVGGGERWQDAPVTHYLSAGIAPYTLLMTGRLANIEWAGDNQWVLTVRPPDARLNAPLPAEVIDRIDFPDAYHDSIDVPVPWILGNFESRGALSNTGALPCYPVDATNMKRFLVSAWWVKDVPWTYRNQTLITSSIPTITRANVNGRRYTFLDFSTSQSGNTITADVYGIEDVGDASGNVIVSPVRQLQFLLRNLLLQEPPWGQNWYVAEHPAIDAASFDALDALLATRAGCGPYTSGWLLSSAMTGYSWIQKVCASNKIGLYWTRDGKLAAGMIDPNADTAAISTWLRWPNDLGQMDLRSDAPEAVGRLHTSYLTDASRYGAPFKLSVADPASTSLAEEDVSLEIGPAAR